VIGKVLDDPAVRPENVYNMDETGIMLSKLSSVKVLVGKDNERGYRGARVKRTTITAIECVSADGRYLNPMIIWPASTHRANWVTHPTPGWHYAYSDSGYTDSYISLQWLKLVYDPQTKERANQKPRILVCDGFGTHETLEVLEFCFENNIILCRLPSHTSHKLQPCDISVFGPLKAAYRDQVERLERGCVGTIGKKHFTYLYSPARTQAFTSRNIRAGWAKAGLFPFNSDKVLCDIPKPLSELNAPRINEVRVGSFTQDRVPQTPATPVSAEALTSLLDMIKQVPDDETNREHKERLQQKHTKATQLSFAERALLQEHNRFLAQINNEAKPRRSTKSDMLGTAKVMSYEDLEKAKAERVAKEIAKVIKKAEKEAKKAAKEAKEATAGKNTRGRKRKGAADVPQPQALSEASEAVGFQMC
jgi:DDE superfamily endonuclease